MFNDKKICQNLLISLREKIKIKTFECVDSTNDVAFDCEPNTLVVARQQTKGRGRENREFYSGIGGIYMSFAVQSKDVDKLTIRVASAVSKAIEMVIGVKTSIKWVNDIIVKGKKVCGILCESRIMGDNIKAVTGIGINFTGKIPDHLSQIAGTLDGNAGDEEVLIAQIINNFFADDNFVEYYKSKSLLLGKTIEVDEKNYLVVDIDDCGGLIMELLDDKNNRTGIKTTKRTGEIRIPLNKQQ